MLRRLALSLVRRFRLSCLTTQELWQARRPRLDLDVLIPIDHRSCPSEPFSFLSLLGHYSYALCACIHSFARVASIVPFPRLVLAWLTVLSLRSLSAVCRSSVPPRPLGTAASLRHALSVLPRGSAPGRPVRPAPVSHLTAQCERAPALGAELSRSARVCPRVARGQSVGHHSLQDRQAVGHHGALAPFQGWADGAARRRPVHASSRVARSRKEVRRS